uniref:Chromosome 12 open reading frame 50 n=1 Tax=Nothoprocta perdicaria TaxID=30464 RepID=A0A8C6ZED2_NOTPE
MWSILIVIFTISENCSFSPPLGCVRISCVFHHSKPRNINGLFLPPSSNITLQQYAQEGTLHPACDQESLKNQENILRPIHPPLIINVNHQEDEDEDEEEENYISYLLAKTAADIEEERAIKEMCYKSGKYEINDPLVNSKVSNVVIFSFLCGILLGEYYGIQSLQEHQSTKTVSSAPEDEQGVISVSLEDNTRTDLRTFENGGGDCFVAQRSVFGEGKGSESLAGEKEPIISKYPNVKGNYYYIFLDQIFLFFCEWIGHYILSTNFTELVKKHQFKGVKKKKWTSEETRNLPNTVTGKVMHTSKPKIKANYQRNDQVKDDESASYIPSVRAAGRRTYLNSSEPGRSAYVFYRNVTVFQEPKLNGSMDKNASGPYNTPTWRKRNPRAKTFSKLKSTIQVTCIKIFAIQSFY